MEERPSRKGRLAGVQPNEPHIMYADNPIKCLAAHMLNLYVEDMEELYYRYRPHFIDSHKTEMSDAEYEAFRKELWRWLGTPQFELVCDVLDFDAQLVGQRLLKKLERL